jgi:hypothetical protein
MLLMKARQLSIFIMAVLTHNSTSVDADLAADGHATHTTTSK